MPRFNVCTLLVVILCSSNEGNMPAVITLVGLWGVCPCGGLSYDVVSGLRGDCTVDPQRPFFSNPG